MYLGTFTSARPLIKPNPDEVTTTAWLPVQRLITWANTLTFPSAEATVAMTWPQLKTQTTPQLFANHDQKNLQKYVIAPWIILMLRDPRLQSFFNQLT
jgi:hypothetical protein